MLAEFHEILHHYSRHHLPALTSSFDSLPTIFLLLHVLLSSRFHPGLGDQCRLFQTFTTLSLDTCALSALWILDDARAL